MRPTAFALVVILPLITSVIGTPTSTAPLINAKIPLSKRASKLVDDQGVVSASALQNELARTRSKLARGFSAFQRNTEPQSQILCKKGQVVACL
ncbi:hypothetical protein HHX47_DHR5000229 [Lentinula edodes]|nr:hypothetical protein HHX47_DHR5000229 [Lentinula edodes]